MEFRRRICTKDTRWDLTCYSFKAEKRLGGQQRLSGRANNWKRGRGGVNLLARVRQGRDSGEDKFWYGWRGCWGRICARPKAISFLSVCTEKSVFPQIEPNPGINLYSCHIDPGMRENKRKPREERRSSAK